MLCEGSFPRKTLFFFSNANAHALSSRRSQWCDNARKERWSTEWLERHSVVFKL
jgi:hypothetical protein